jgi:hypothetical protein
MFTSIFKIALIACFLCLFNLIALTKDVLILNTNLLNAYNDITRLRINDGLTDISLSKLKEPNNALVHYIENYADFFILFIGEEEKEYRSRLKNRDFRLRKIKNADSNSPYYLFAQAEILLQWAVVKLKFGDKVSAASDVLDAYNLLVENNKKYPEFYPNNKSLSIIHAMAESLPSWVRKIVGVKGSVKMGLNEIKSLVDRLSRTKEMYFEESVAIYSYILFYADNKKELAYQTLISHNLDHRSNPLVTFLKATMAQKTGRNEACIKYLEQRPQGGGFLPFYYLDFIYGKALLFKLEKSSLKYINNYISNFKGRHYIKEAYQKIAWYHLAVNNDVMAYSAAIKFTTLYGVATVDEDIQAVNEAKNSLLPDRTLLQARLFFDGGYYTKAKEMLIPISMKYRSSNHLDEYNYRLGRITESMGETKAAINYYQKTVSQSKTNRYFACSAALQLALLYENSKQLALSRQYFNKCLLLKPDEYADGLHAKAKAGLHRVGK